MCPSAGFKLPPPAVSLGDTAVSLFRMATIKISVKADEVIEFTEAIISEWLMKVGVPEFQREDLISLAICVRADEMVSGKWKELAARLAPIFKTRNTMMEKMEVIKEIIANSLSDAKCMAYFYDEGKKKHSSKLTFAQRERRREHNAAVDHVRTVFNRVLNYAFPVPKAKPMPSIKAKLDGTCPSPLFYATACLTPHPPSPSERAAKEIMMEEDDEKEEEEEGGGGGGGGGVKPKRPRSADSGKSYVSDARSEEDVFETDFSAMGVKPMFAAGGGGGAAALPPPRVLQGNRELVEDIKGTAELCLGALQSVLTESESGEVLEKVEVPTELYIDMRELCKKVSKL